MPDLAVVPGGPRNDPQHPATANLVLEVADTSLDFDTTNKRLLYSTAEIPENWVLDVNDRRLLVFRDPKAGDYMTRLVLGRTDSVSPLAAPASIVNVVDLLA